MSNYVSGSGYLYFVKQCGDGYWMIHRQARSIGECKTYGRWISEEEAQSNLDAIASVKGWHYTVDEPNLAIKNRAHQKAKHLGKMHKALEKKAIKWFPMIKPHLPGSYTDIGDANGWSMATTLLRVNNCLTFGKIHVCSEPGEYPVMFAEGDGDKLPPLGEVV